MFFRFFPISFGSDRLIFRRNDPKTGRDDTVQSREPVTELVSFASSLGSLIAFSRLFTGEWEVSSSVLWRNLSLDSVYSINLQEDRRSCNTLVADQWSQNGDVVQPTEKLQASEPSTPSLHERIVSRREIAHTESDLCKKVSETERYSNGKRWNTT